MTVIAQDSPRRDYYNKEITYFNKKIKEAPNDIKLIHARATTYDDLNLFELSNKDFRTVIELYFSDPSREYLKEATDACYYLADDYFFRKSDRIKAQVFVDHGQAISPKDKRFEVLQLGILGSYPEKREIVKKQFEELLLKHPDDEKLTLYYAKFLEKEDIPRSTNLYERAVEINPRNVDALFALGSYYSNEASQIYKSNGDPGKVLQYMEKGVAYFESVHKLTPHDKEIVEILVEFYGYLRRYDDAERMEKQLMGM